MNCATLGSLTRVVFSECVGTGYPAWGAGNSEEGMRGPCAQYISLKPRPAAARGPSTMDARTASEAHSSIVGGPCLGDR